MKSPSRNPLVGTGKAARVSAVRAAAKKRALGFASHMRSDAVFYPAFLDLDSNTLELYICVEQLTDSDIDPFGTKVQLCLRKMSEVASLSRWEFAVNLGDVKEMQHGFLGTLIATLKDLRDVVALAYCHNVKHGTPIARLMEASGLLDTFALGADGLGVDNDAQAVPTKDDVWAVSAEACPRATERKCKDRLGLQQYQAANVAKTKAQVEVIRKDANTRQVTVASNADFLVRLFSRRPTVADQIYKDVSSGKYEQGSDMSYADFLEALWELIDAGWVIERPFDSSWRTIAIGARRYSITFQGAYEAAWTSDSLPIPSTSLIAVNADYQCS